MTSLIQMSLCGYVVLFCISWKHATAQICADLDTDIRPHDINVTMIQPTGNRTYNTGDTIVMVCEWATKVSCGGYLEFKRRNLNESQSRESKHIIAGRYGPTKSDSYSDIVKAENNYRNKYEFIGYYNGDNTRGTMTLTIRDAKISDTQTYSCVYKLSGNEKNRADVDITVKDLPTMTPPDPTGPTTSHPPAPTTEGVAEPHEPPLGPILGGVLGGLLAVVIIMIIVYVIYRHKKRNKIC